MATSQQTSELEGNDRSLKKATPPLLTFSVMPRNHDRGCSGKSIGERAAIRTSIPKAKRGKFLFSSKCGSLRGTAHKRQYYRGRRRSQLIKWVSPVHKSAASGGGKSLSDDAGAGGNFHLNHNQPQKGFYGI